DLLDLLVDLDHLRTSADDRAELHRLETLGERLALPAQLVEKLCGLDEEGGLAGKDLEGLELLGAKEVFDVVVADVDQSQELATDQQRHTHHRAQLEVDDREAVLKARVVQRVRDDLRLLAGDDLADDVVGEQLSGVVDGAALQVTRGL